MMRPKNKQRCLITVNVLIALWTSVEMIRCWGKGDILIGIANAEIAVWAVSEISGLVRKARKVSDGITNESTMESTGDFIWYLCFILFCVFFAVCFVISPDLRRKSVAITNPCNLCEVRELRAVVYSNRLENLAETIAVLIA
jgi:uncharacterized protein involved in response to NO